MERHSLGDRPESESRQPHLVWGVVQRFHLLCRCRRHTDQSIPTTGARQVVERDDLVDRRSAPNEAEVFSLVCLHRPDRLYGRGLAAFRWANADPDPNRGTAPRGRSFRARTATSTNNVLSGVSCDEPTSCTAVGGYNNGSGVTRTLIESWNGSQWKIVPEPQHVSHQPNNLNGVSCTPAIDVRRRWHL